MTTTRAAKREATGRRILAAAQTEFGEKGLDGATIRSIAQRAGVDPSLVMQRYGSKRDLFAEAIRLVADDDHTDVDAHLATVVDVRLDHLPPATRSLVRSMLTAPEARDAMREYLQGRADRLAATSDDPDAQLRATLTVSAILGLTITRHFLELDGLDAVTDGQLERVVRPWVGAAMRGD